MSHVNHSVKPCPLIGPFEPGGPNLMLILLYDFTPKTARSFRLTPAALRLELRTIPDCSKNSKTF